jgi:adenylate cyclase
MRRFKQLRLYWLVAFLACAVTLPFGEFSTPMRTNIENLIFDQFQRWRPRPYDFEQPVRVVDIDDESIRRFGQWPWPRERMAALVDTLANAHVAAVAFDILFSEKERVGAGSSDGGDDAFAKAIADRPTVLGSFFTDAPTGVEIPAKAGFAVAGDDPASFLHQAGGALAPLPVFSQNAAGIGFMNWRPDADRVVRQVPLILSVNGKLQPSLAMEALRVAQGASTYVVKSSNASGETAFGQVTGVNTIKNGEAIISTQPAGDVRVYFAKSDPRRSTPAWKVFEPGADLSDLEGKIVFVGVGALLLSDIVATPLDASTPGVEAHAQLIEQILSGVTLIRPDWAHSAELVMTALLSFGLVAALPALSAVWCALLGAVATATLASGSWFAFARYGLLFDPVFPSLSSGAVYVAGVLALYGQKRRQEREIRSAFGRFVSPAVVARLAEHPENLQLGGLQRELTVMFCDIRSFTTLSEGFSAVELTHFLNDYLTPMTDAVLDELGTVDKYMGDAIVAFWNAPLDDPDHAAHAVNSALAMRSRLAVLNDNWLKQAEASGRAFATVKFGVGLNTGECCVGNLGSRRRFDYSAIGDEVNVASRLEGSSKVFGVDIVASDATRAEAPDYAWLEIDRVLLKNKTRPVGIHALAGDETYAASASFHALAQKHESMLEAYRRQDFDAAADLAADTAQAAPEEVRGLYRYYRERFALLGRSVIADDWRPVIVLEEK